MRQKTERHQDDPDLLLKRVTLARLAGDSARAANTDEVKHLRREAQECQTYAFSHSMMILQARPIATAAIPTLRVP